MMTVPGVDFGRLVGWMDSQRLGEGPIEEPIQLGGGTQNILLQFRRGADNFVLRRPPLHKRPNSDNTMVREARVLSALRHSDVPHPRIIAACEDEAVLGAVFYLMEPVDGINPTVQLPGKYLTDPGWRRELGLSVADGAASVGAVDYRAVGLGDLGRVDGYLERQVARWRSQLESYRAFDGYGEPRLPGVEEISHWLDKHRPRTWRPGLIHGDYQLSNVLCWPDRPEVAAIVDWEMTTIGDPLVDLGWLLITWPGPNGPEVGTIGAKPWDGFPSREELVTRYASRSDRDLSALEWYEVLAGFKAGIVLEGTHARACAGQADESIGAHLHATAVGLFERAYERMGSEGRG